MQHIFFLYGILRMTDCPFTLNADKLWQCPDCGWVYKRKSDKSPHRNCPKKITDEDRKRMAFAREQMTEDRGQIFPQPTPEQQAEAERQRKEATEAGEQLGWKPEHAAKYAVALIRWVAAGRPTRTDEEVAAIVATCLDCEKYEKDSGRCKVCGCKVHTPGIAILSKAKLETERCPKDKW